jgi:hypothetical protein
MGLFSIFLAGAATANGKLAAAQGKTEGDGLLTVIGLKAIEGFESSVSCSPKRRACDVTFFAAWPNEILAG